MNARIWQRGDLRLLLVGVVFIAAWVGIGVKLFDLQGTQALANASYGWDQRVRERTVAAPRGTIFDRDGVELAMTIDGYNVVADPTLIDDPVLAATVLAPYSDMTAEELGAAIIEGQADNRQYLEIAMRVDSRTKATIEAAVAEAGFIGIFYRKQPLRVYPSGTIASQVVGLIRLDDGVGIEGLEKTFDSELRGREGRTVVEVDRDGRVIPQGQTLIDPAVPGSDIVTTIDREIQFSAEQALRRAIQKTNAIGGTIVVLLPETGEIVAMASWPDLDLNERSDITPNVLRNRAVQDVYEPGSTLKTITIAAALEEGIVTAKTPIDTPPSVTIGEFDYQDHSNFPAWMSVEDVLSRSSNVGTIEIQRRLGNETHYEYLTAFGLGRGSGLDVAGERQGLLDEPKIWTRTSGSSIAIGYAVGTTALQMAAVYATIANDGVWIEPYLVQEIIRPDGTRIETHPRSRRVLSPETAAEMRRMLGRVIDMDNGTGRRARMTDYTAGGKTGTSQKVNVDEGGYSDDTVASFIGMAPLSNPRVVVVIVLDTPNGRLEDGTDMSFGGASAAPVFAEVARDALHRLGVAPDKD